MAQRHRRRQTFEDRVAEALLRKLEERGMVMASGAPVVAREEGQCPGDEKESECSDRTPIEMDGRYTLWTKKADEILSTLRSKKKRRL
jgi:hypothetical protein